VITSFASENLKRFFDHPTFGDQPQIAFHKSRAHPSACEPKELGMSIVRDKRSVNRREIYRLEIGTAPGAAFSLIVFTLASV
jgi:hypothetical protein